MPELPEVESIRRGLVRASIRAPIVEVWRSPLPLRTGAAWRRERLDRLVAATSRRWRRRGKFLIWELRCGDDDVGLLIHLGMTGRLGVVGVDAPVEPHTHVRLRFADDRELRFVDPRRFGGVRAEPLAVLWNEPPLSRLGPELLARGFGGPALAARAAASRRCVYDVVMDQRVVAGVGNIYAQEALFVAGLHPLLRADRLSASAWDRLAASVVAVLRQGLANGGTSFRDYRNASGRRGRNQDALWVYGRDGAACRRCGATLRAHAHGGRRFVVCPVDQARPRTRRVP